MPYFKDASGGLHFLSNEDIANGGAALLPSGCTEITDAQAQAIQNPSMTLAQAQSGQIASLVSAYQNAIQQPVSYTSKGGITKTFQADTGSQDTLAKELAIYSQPGATIPSGYYWVAADNTQVPFTLADLQGLTLAMGAQGWTAFSNLQTKKAAVLAATSVSSVQAITF